MKFPELSYDAFSAEAAQYNRRRVWKSSLANWTLFVLLITGGLVYISQSLDVSMPSTWISSQRMQDSSDNVEAQANSTWFLTGWQATDCHSLAIGPFTGTNSTNCSNLAPGITGFGATWAWTEADHFELQLFGAQDCENLVSNLTAKALCAPVTYFSWKVVSSNSTK